MPTKDLLRVAQAAQAIALTGENLKFAKKKKKTTKDFVKAGAKNIVGTSMISSQGKIISTI